MNLKNQSAITLISLIVTIIIIIILAGISINLILGENGLINRVNSGKELYNESSAKEKLKMDLAYLSIQKETNSEYNEQYLDNYLSQKGYVVNGDIVSVDGWQFQIDREQLIILDNIVKISHEVYEYKKDTDGIYNVGISLNVKSNTQIKEITVINPDGTEKIKYHPDNLSISENITVLLKNEYKVIVITSDGKEFSKNIIVDFGISTPTEFVAFANAVNNGETFEGQTIELINDIDLSSICGENIGNWTPIGSNGTYFSGTLDGHHHILENLYINTNSCSTSALFEQIPASATIQNLTVKDIYIYNTFDDTGTCNVAGIVAINYGTISNCSTSGGSIIQSQETSSSVWKCSRVGGIASHNQGNIINCFNTSTISAISSIYGKENYGNAGGIVGMNYINGLVDNCYNSGNISTSGYWAMVGGIASNLQETSSLVRNSYNYGNISITSGNQKFIGGVAGTNGTGKGIGTISNCYCTTDTSYSYYYSMSTAITTGRTSSDALKASASTLGDAWIEDGKKKTDTGEYIDNKDSDGNIIYINNGYPILKWQIDNK